MSSQVHKELSVQGHVRMLSFVQNTLFHEKLSYPHPHLKSPSQYTPKAWRTTAKIADKVFIIICQSMNALFHK